MAVTTTKALLKDAVHHNRFVSRRGAMERLFTFWFRGFIYNQIWEDPRVDAQAMELARGHRVLTISSGGCNVLNYLVHEPEQIVAIDLNTSHMSLTRLKLAALEHLPSYEDFFNFFGLGRHEDNLKNYYQYVRPHLDAVTRKFWETSHWPGRKVGPKRIKYFSKGLYNQSKLGRLIRMAHLVGRITRKDYEAFLNAQTREEQEAIFDRVVEPYFKNRLVRWISRSPMTVFSLGIPPAQYKALRAEAEGQPADIYRDRLRKLACAFPMDDNYFAWQAFGRRYDSENKRALPCYLREENYELLRSNLHRVETHITSLGGFLKTQEAGALDRFVLLDSQDWMPAPVITELWSEIARVGAPGTRVIFRTAGERSPIEAALPPDLRRQFVYQEELSRELHEQDRSAIYGMFHLYTKPN